MNEHDAPPRASDEARRPPLDEAMAIEPGALERAFFGSSSRTGDAGFTLEGDVAVVSVDGPLVQRGGWFFDGYASVKERFDAALAAKGAKAVVLKLNSPGGTVAGMAETVRAMRASKAAAGKPVFAYADEAAYSAAYALATVADQIWLPDTGGVGSVGVISAIYDQSAAVEAAGVKAHIITSGKYKAEGHPHVKTSSETIARAQARVDDLARVFAGLVSDARGLSERAVLGLEAATFTGARAVTVGLADHVGSLAACLEAAANAGQAAGHKGPAPRAGAEGTSTMATNEGGAPGADVGGPVANATGQNENATAPEASAPARTEATPPAPEGAEKALCEATGKATLAEAIEALAGLVAAAKERDALVAEKVAAAEQAKKDECKAVLDAAEKAGKLTPASRKALEAKAGDDAAWLRDFLAVKGREVPSAGVTEAGGQAATEAAASQARWEDLTPMQKHNLAASNRALFDALRADYRARTGA